jgi:hypothetical protein
MTSILAISPRSVPVSVLIGVLIGISLSISMSACTSSAVTSARVGTSLTEEEKHRLYAAAMAASEFPLESKTFKKVCEKIGIFDAQGNQNDNYLGFITAHIEWAMKTENQPFKSEINTQEKARTYVEKYLP